MNRAEHEVRRTIWSKVLRRLNGGDVENFSGEGQRCQSVGDNRPGTAKASRDEGQTTQPSEQSPNPGRARELAGSFAQHGPAPVELQLSWLLRALEGQRERYRGQRVDALAVVARNDPKGSYLDRPDIRVAKARSAAAVFNQVINGLDWLLSKKRPWNKSVKPNNEQSPREQQRASDGTAGGVS